MAKFVERWTRDRKVASSNPGRSSGRILFSRVNFLCRLLIGFRSTPVLLPSHVEDPGHSAKSASGRLHVNMHTPLIQGSQSALIMLSTHGMKTGQRNELTRNSPRNAQPQSSQLAEPLWTDRGLEGGTGVFGLISS